MSKFTVTSLNYVVSGQKEKIFNLDVASVPRLGQDGVDLRNVSYVADLSPTDEMASSQRFNKGNFWLVDAGMMVHALYDMKDVCLKSSIKKASSAASDGDLTSEDYVDIYAPDFGTNPIGFCGLEGYAYGVSQKTNMGPNSLVTDLAGRRDDLSSSQSYIDVVSGDALKTYLYEPVTELKKINGVDELTGYGQYLSAAYMSPVDALSAVFEPKYNLAGVQYNYLLEIPQNADSWNDYDSGNVMCDVFNGKNAYGALYSMNVVTGPAISSSTLDQATFDPDSVDAQPGRRPNPLAWAVLSAARDYCGIGVCGDEIFLKYYDNVNYAVDGSNGKSGGVTDLSARAVLSSDGAAPRFFKKFDYQKIEVIQSVNRFVDTTNHSSNLYSLRISGTGLADPASPLPETVREKLRQDVEHNVRQMVKSICPVDTQLFKVYFRN